MSAIREVDLIAPIEVAGPADDAGLFIAQIPRDVAWASRCTERVLGPVLIEVKALHGHGLPAAVNQLAVFLARSGAMFGLVVYDGPGQVPGPASGFPIAVMHITELREHVRRGNLGSTLVYSRNAVAHGLSR